jgi:hypothetical protein
VLSKRELKTVQGGVLIAGMVNGATKINGANLVSTDIDASNGVIHVIDSVLLPPAPPKMSQSSQAHPQQVIHVCPDSGRVTGSAAQPAGRP